jgi:predicted ABC-type ATPase
VKPVLIVIAGPNGAGKTTVTDRIRRDHWSDGVTYLNPDEVARDRFGDWNSPDAVRQAADWVAERRNELLRQSESLAFETVLSMPDKLDFIEKAKQAGYFVRAFFVSTTDPTINAARVARRVMEGGHTVPIEKIVSRYARSMTHLRRLVALCDRTYVYDNSVEGAEARLVARFVDGGLRKTYGASPAWVALTLAGAPKHPAYEAI